MNSSASNMLAKRKVISDDDKSQRAQSFAPAGSVFTETKPKIIAYRSAVQTVALYRFQHVIVYNGDVAFRLKK